MLAPSWFVLPIRIILLWGMAWGFSGIHRLGDDDDDDDDDLTVISASRAPPLRT